ncbi:MAG: ABC transporter substrate binding protein [Gammaproteobacteria bacterium]
MRARAMLAFALIAMAMSALPAHARPVVHFVLSEPNGPYREVFVAARTALGGDATVSVGALDDAVPESASAIVAVGTAAAARWAGSDDPRAVFATLVPSAGWQRLVRGDTTRRSALFLDQPLTRQLALVRVLLPPLRELGVVYGPSSVARRDAVLDAADRFHLFINAHHATSSVDIDDAFLTVLRRSEALLALPDSAVFTRFNVQSLLLTSFRLRRPVIGFSESWVRAGALAAVHTTPAQLGAELGAEIATWLSDRGPLPASRTPMRYTLSVNRQVAFSLGLNLAPDAVLQQRIRALLGEHP